MTRKLDSSYGLMQLVSPETYWVPAENAESVNDDTELHLGWVRAYRWWTMTAPLLHAWPVPEVADEWDPGWLQATNGMPWMPGVNVAGCTNTYAPHAAADIPSDSCGCGYWGYWKPQMHDLPHGRLPVFGAIDVAGDVIIAEYGLRGARARIAALHLPLTIGPKQAPQSRFDPWAGFPGKVYNYNMPPKPPPPPEPGREEIAEAEMRGEAWVAVIGDRLRQMYPGTEVCETRDLLVAKYPPDAAYGAMTSCQWCREPGVPYGHEYACQKNPFRGSAAV